MWASLIPVAAKLIMYLLDRSGASAETKKKFADFLMAIQDDAAISVKIKNSLTAQREKLKERLEAQKKGQG